MVVVVGAVNAEIVCVVKLLAFKDKTKKIHFHIKKNPHLLNFSWLKSYLKDAGNLLVNFF